MLTRWFVLAVLLTECRVELRFTGSQLLRILEETTWHKEKVCQTFECKEAAEELQSNLNLSVNPCVDFYEFACGGWIARHAVPSTESHWNQFNLVDDKLNRQLKELLEIDDGAEDPAPVKAAKQSYAACMDLDGAESVGLSPLVSLLSEFSHWPIASHNWVAEGFDWLQMLGALTRRYALTPLVFVYVYIDRKNSNDSVLTVDQPSLVLPRSMLLDRETYSEQLSSYKEWIVQSALLVAKHSNQSIQVEEVRREAVEIIAFEMAVAKLTSPSEMRRNGFRTYNSMTLRQLQKWTDTAATTDLPVIDWLSLIRTIFTGTDVTFDWAERIVVRELDFLFNLVKLLQVTPTRVIANYMHWRVVKTFSRDLTQQMRRLAFEFDRELTGASEDQPRWRDCVSGTSSALSMAVGFKYVKLYFDDVAQKSAQEMTDNIRAVFLSEIEKISWMDDTTREAAMHKVKVMTQFIGYPQWYRNERALHEYYADLAIGRSHFANTVATRMFNMRQAIMKLRFSTDRNEWPISPAVVNAYYNPQMNSIIFPAGILQAPFYSPDRIQALNYGGIGVVIGHEMTHGFDDIGRQSDALGNLAQWWSEATIETYLKKAQCFIDQYGSFRVPQLDETLLRRVTMNGVTTQGENMADNGGLHQALLAYRKYILQNGPEKCLPGLEQFTPEQLFFIGFATNWCESSTRESLLQEVLNDPHSPHRFRVQGTVANSPEFARAFNCPPGSPMNPSEKCHIW